MVKLLGYLVIVIIGLGGGVGYQWYLNQSGTKSEWVDKVIPLPTPKPKVVLVQPSQALETRVSQVTGQVILVPWDKFEDQEVLVNQGLAQGDELKTSKEASLSLNIGQEAEIEIGEESAVHLASLVKDTLVIKQTVGKVRYQTQTRLNIFVGRSLVELNSGTAEVSFNEKQAEISVISGEITLGYNNNQGVTQVWQIKAGQGVEINDLTGQVDTPGERLSAN